MAILKTTFLSAIVLGSLVLPRYCFSQLKKHAFEEIDSLQKTDKRNIVVFIHTHWCCFCKNMENTTFKDEKVIKTLNGNFYFTKLNAEEKRDIPFAGKVFNYIPNGTNSGTHQLAIELGTKKALRYPTIVILNAKNEILLQHDSYLNAVQLLQILRKL